MILSSFEITTDQLLDQWPLYVGCLTVKQTSPQLINRHAPPALPRQRNPGDWSLENQGQQDRWYDEVRHLATNQLDSCVLRHFTAET